MWHFYGNFIPNLQSYFLCFLQKFSSYGFIFSTMIHFQLTFMYGIQQRSKLFITYIIVPVPFIKGLFLSLVNFFGNLIENELFMCWYMASHLLNINLCVYSLLKPCYLYYDIYNQVWKPDPFRSPILSLFSRSLDSCRSFGFQIKFQHHIVKIYSKTY